MTWTPDDAAHLLRRAGFGGTREDVDRLHALGKVGAVDAIVDYEKTADAVWSNDNPFGLPDVLDEWDGVRTALLWQMLKSRRPLQAKLLWFWHGHFTTPTSAAGTLLFRRQMNTWRTYANGSFAAFLSAVYKDGAMLEYLNGSYSHKDRPNENFAREVQELYTTGTGPFREADVREAARALTGWEVTWPDRDVVFNPASFDAGTKTFLGQTGNLTGEDIMRILAQRPETARRTCAKLYRAFVSERVNLVEVNGLVKRWSETGGNIKAVMRALFQLPSFWDVRTRGFMFKTPLELILGLMQRLELDLDLDRARAVGWMSHQMGQDPFEPPNPAGYRTGLRLTGASMLLGRTQMAENLIFNWASPASIAILHAGLPRPTPPDQLVATVAARLGVTNLTAGTRASIANFLGSAPIPQANIEDRTRSVAFLVASSPEYQVM